MAESVKHGSLFDYCWRAYVAWLTMCGLTSKKEPDVWDRVLRLYEDK